MARGLLSPISTALTAIVGLVDLGSESKEQNYLTWLTTGTSFLGSGLDLYEQQFLFDADNIDAVRGLTMRELSAHADGILAQQNISFDSAVRDLVDHEMICTPAHILETTRAAIKNGSVTPRTQGTSTAPTNTNGQTPGGTSSEEKTNSVPTDVNG